jgi:c-di-GMP-related signal transduction protein
MCYRCEIVKACKELKRSGFRLALDDFSRHEDKGKLVEIADYVKVETLARCGQHKRKVTPCSRLFPFSTGGYCRGASLYHSVRLPATK